MLHRRCIKKSSYTQSLYSQKWNNVEKHNIIFGIRKRTNYHNKKSSLPIKKNRTEMFIKDKLTFLLHSEANNKEKNTEKAGWKWTRDHIKSYNPKLTNVYIYKICFVWCLSFLFPEDIIGFNRCITLSQLNIYLVLEKFQKRSTLLAWSLETKIVL